MPSADISETRDHGKSICTAINIEHLLYYGDDGFGPAKKEQRCRVIDDSILIGIRDEFPGFPEKGNDNAEPVEEIESREGI